MLAVNDASHHSLNNEYHDKKNNNKDKERERKNTKMV